MRIVIPNFCPPDTFVDNVAFTLRFMGHEVYTLGEVATSRAFSSTRRLYRHVRELIPGYMSPQEKWLIKAVKRYRPDIILALTQSISEECLFETKKLGVKLRVAWWGDALGNMSKMGLFNDEWDCIYLKDAFAVSRFKMIGLKADLLYEAMNPHWHKVLAAQSNDYCLVAGNYYGLRQYLVRKLHKSGVKLQLFGPSPPSWSLQEVKDEHIGRYIIKEEKSKYFGEAMVCLNTTHIMEGNSLNCRAFEIAGAGGLQITEHRSVITDCFIPNEEILVFQNYDELLDLLERARCSPQEMQRIRESGARRALSEHTYRHRLEIILQNYYQS